jgi:hypothetical protein
MLSNPHYKVWHVCCKYLDWNCCKQLWKQLVWVGSSEYMS